jgi:ATP-dependent protease ClpP protease subunit
VPISPDLKLDHDLALSETGQFFLTGEITQERVTSLGLGLLRWAETHQSENPRPEVTLHLFSDGGSVNAGLQLGHVLQRVRRDYGYRVVARVTGYTASMGTVLLQFADVRQMDALTLLMLHDIQFSLGFGDTVQHQARVQRIAFLRTTVAGIYAARNTRRHTDPAWWLEHYLDAHEHFLTAQQALDLGLIDEIVGDFPRPPVP